MANIFNSVKFTKTVKSVFDLSHDVKLSLNMGQLVPTCCMECVPGDKFHISCDSLIRFAPLVSPVMHRMDVRMEYFFVPNRLLWPQWEKYITNSPSDDTDDPGGPIPVHPTIELTDANYTQLMDYLGLPIPFGGMANQPITALPFAAYQMIYNEYYRDQNLIDKVIFELSDGANDGNIGPLTQLRTRAWEHDYFTSALPFAQKGAPVAMPLGLQDAPIKRDTDPTLGDTGEVLTGLTVPGNVANQTAVPYQLSADPNTISGELYADNSAVTGTSTINDLRKAFKLQEWLEKAARGGSRMIEMIKAQFGVSSSDKRLDRPEYIVGTKSPVVISEVLSTAETAGNPQANMAGHAVSVTNGQYGGYYCEEHGYIIGIMSVMPKTAYFQGIPKHFLKYVDPLQDYLWPDFANLGEQEILIKELFAGVTTGDNIFGYIPRYAEYKFQPSRVAGQFRTTLDFWHMARRFISVPALNAEFIEADYATMSQIFAVEDPDAEQIYAHILHKIKSERKLPKFGIPSY